MREIILKYSTGESSGEIVFEGEKISFGRGSDADFRFEDTGLSRLHATLCREADKVWIVDENSTNGTFVNGEKVGAGGTPVGAGDRIKIGHFTSIKFETREKSSAREPEFSSAAAANSSADNGFSSVRSGALAAESSDESSSMLIPIVVTALALLIVGASIVFIGVSVLGSGGAAESSESETENIFTESSENSSDTASVEDSKIDADKLSAPDDSNASNTAASENANSNEAPDVTAAQTENTFVIPAGKTYLQMSEDEKRQYIAAKTLRVAQMIGNQNTGTIPPLAIERIKAFTDAYAKRLSVRPLGGCRFGDNLQATYERASKNAPFINRAFKQHGIDPQIGLYLAMIESEHCVCLQSPTGPLGMFQFTQATGAAYGLRIIRGATPANPDERCEPRPAAVAAAKYMKFLTGRYGTGPSSVPLAIGSYNSGEGGLSRNLVTALDSNEGLPRDFWTLIANGEKLSKQFQSENFKYVPKFFAAAIVGENPRDFGLDLRPLSTYSN